MWLGCADEGSGGLKKKKEKKKARPAFEEIEPLREYLLFYCKFIVSVLLESKLDQKFLLKL